MSLIKSRQRIADHGEVFTPEWMVDSMLDLIKSESYRLDSRVLEPACGSGNFLVKILKRKLATVKEKFGKSEFENMQYSMLALMCTYGIELLPDNVLECRNNMLRVFSDYLNIKDGDVAKEVAKYVLRRNIVHGDALSMLTNLGNPISFSEWGYIGQGKFQRRDFRYSTLTQMSNFSDSGSLFADMGIGEIFSPAKTYAPMSILEIFEASKVEIEERK